MAQKDLTANPKGFYALCSGPDAGCSHRESGMALVRILRMKGAVRNVVCMSPPISVVHCPQPKVKWSASVGNFKKCQTLSAAEVLVIPLEGNGCTDAIKTVTWQIGYR